MASLVLFLGGNSRAAVAHTCSATDRQFMSVAQLNMAALGSLSEDYLHGDAKPAEVIDQTQSAILGLRRRCSDRKLRLRSGRDAASRGTRAGGARAL